MKNKVVVPAQRLVPGPISLRSRVIYCVSDLQHSCYAWLQVNSHRARFPMTAKHHREFEEWAKSLEEADAGTNPETGKPLVSPTEWRRLDEVAMDRCGNFASRVFHSIFGKLR
jgi:hypothetical protein